MNSETTRYNALLKLNEHELRNIVIATERKMAALQRGYFCEMKRAHELELKLSAVETTALKLKVEDDRVLTPAGRAATKDGVLDVDLAARLEMGETEPSGVTRMRFPEMPLAEVRKYLDGEGVTDTTCQECGATILVRM